MKLTEETDLDYEMVRIVRYFPVFRTWAMPRYKEISLREFFKKINGGKIRAEIVDEYYNGDSVYYKLPMGVRKNCGLTIRCKEKLYKTIEDSLNELSDMKEKIKGNNMFGKFSFGLSINTKAGTNESIVSFLAQSGDKSYSAGSTNELIKLISGSNTVDRKGWKAIEHI